MKPTPTSPTTQTTRRQFLARSGKAALGTTLVPAVASPGYTAENHTLEIALIGCGGRGTGAAANALETKGPTRLRAMADFFPNRLETSLNTLRAGFKAQVDVPLERRFVGLDGYRKAIDVLEPGGVVILATPPAFRPIHFEYAIHRSQHVFMEKSFAVDAPGVRRLLRAGEEAKRKNLKVAGGLMWHHDPARQAVIERIHEGAIGDVISLRTYRMHGAVGYQPKPPGMSELAHQIANYNCFTWLNGSFFVDWLIHNLDVCCWAKNALPISAQGMGGRIARGEPDPMYDHYAVEYFFADGTILHAQGRHINRCWDIFSDFAHGSRGSAVIMESLANPRPRIYRNHRQIPENETWRYQGPTPDPYQVEHDLLFEAIRGDKPYNETERCARATLLAILGRMAVESGQWVTWDEASASEVELAPGLEHYLETSNPPVLPDANGRYPVPVPGARAVL